jgi:hypothetical protein
MQLAARQRSVGDGALPLPKNRPTIKDVFAMLNQGTAVAGHMDIVAKRAVSWSTAAPNSTASRAVAGATNATQSEVQSTVHRPTVFVNKVVRFSKRLSLLFLATPHARAAGSARPL